VIWLLVYIAVSIFFGICAVFAASYHFEWSRAEAIVIGGIVALLWPLIVIGAPL
jgi:hypothetical protein